MDEFDFDFTCEKLNKKIIVPTGWKVEYTKFDSPTFTKGSTSVDLWQLSNHNWIKERHLEASIENLFAGVPFTIQAMAYDIRNKKVIGERGIEALLSREFRVNNLKTAQDLAKRKRITVDERMKDKAESMGFTFVPIGNISSKILVTSYECPDLDGTACAYAYAEFLNKSGKPANVAIFKIPHREARFVMNYFGITIEDAEKFVKNTKTIVLVDASEIENLPKSIDSKKVIEIIDHRKANDAEKFPNAKIQIELVGAAATLVAEHFYKSKIDISKEAAALLYSAIVSNTINFRANVTTQRDRKMATWLLTKTKISKNYIHSMFQAKSKFEESIDYVLDEDMAIFKFGNKKLGIMQLEIIDVEAFVRNNIRKIKNAMIKIKDKERFDFVFLNCIDLEKAINEFVALDANTKTLLVKSLHIKFDGDTALRNGIIMRKEIVPKLKETLEAS